MVIVPLAYAGAFVALVVTLLFCATIGPREPGYPYAAILALLGVAAALCAIAIPLWLWLMSGR